jgi:hypothetical protein
MKVTKETYQKLPAKCPATMSDHFPTTCSQLAEQCTTIENGLLGRVMIALHNKNEA